MLLNGQRVAGQHFHFGISEREAGLIGGCNILDMRGFTSLGFAAKHHLLHLLPSVRLQDGQALCAEPV